VIIFPYVSFGKDTLANRSHCEYL